MGGLLDSVFGKPAKMPQSSAETTTAALGRKQLADYEQNYKPIAATVAAKKLSRTDNRDLHGPANADAAQAAAGGMERARRGYGLRGPAGLTTAAVQAGARDGMTGALAGQQEEDVYVKDLVGGAALGRNLSGMANTAMANSAAAQMKRDYLIYQDKAEAAARRSNAVGETIGLGMGAYAQYKASPQAPRRLDGIPTDAAGELQFDP